MKAKLRTSKSLEFLDKTVTRDEKGRYSVLWPWRAQTPHFSDNFGLCLGRLKWKILGRLSSKKEKIRDVKGGQIKVFYFELTNDTGHTMQIVAFNGEAEKYYNEIKLGKMYYVGGSKMKNCDKSFNTTNHDYEIWLKWSSQPYFLTKLKVTARGTISPSIPYNLNFGNLNLNTANDDSAELELIKCSSTTLYIYFPSDKLSEPHFSPCCFVVNTLPSYRSATLVGHWVCFYLESPNVAYYFDSLAQAEKYDLRKFLSEYKCVYEIAHALQSDVTDNCEC
ncbi:unnamed protein product [Enterobius vermicularis]|uniref:OB domain-containing protein n=1 Tax=Enterobius vermicularis TaxID=51028 RepID=A0A0N4VA67_ENTVE|nr:unnamed protein product [Enterobius vermicularis]